MKTPMLYVILKKIITKGMIYMQTATKSISLFNTYELPLPQFIYNAFERLKSPTRSQLIFFLLPDPDIFDFELNT